MDDRTAQLIFKARFRTSLGQTQNELEILKMLDGLGDGQEDEDTGEANINLSKKKSHEERPEKKKTRHFFLH